MMVPRPVADAVRPRVEGEREAEILDAAVEELMEQGYDRLTMDAVAARAKASKATLYRRWSSKQSLVVDAVIRSKKAPGPVDVDTGSLRGDLVAFACGPAGLTERKGVQLFSAVITAMNTDPVFAREFRERVIAPRISVVQTIYDRARARGEVAADCDLSLIGPALPAILLHRALFMGEQVTDALVEKVVDCIILPAATAGSRPATGPPPTRKDRA